MREVTLPGKTNDIEELLPGHYGGHDECVPGLGGVVLSIYIRHTIHHEYIGSKHE